MRSNNYFIKKMNRENELDLNKAAGDWPLAASQELPEAKSQKPAA